MWIGIGITLASAARGGNGAYVLLRDMFLQADDPITTGAARPGAGTHTITGGDWYTKTGKLFGGSDTAETVWGNSKVVWDGFARLNGRTLWAIVRPEDRQSPLAFSWATATNIGDPTTDGHGWAIQDGSVDIITPSLLTNLDASIHDMRPMLYLVAIVQLDAGAALLISTVSADSTTSPGRTTPWSVPAYPSAAIAHITRRGTATPLYPLISAHSSPNTGEAIQGHTVDDVRVIDVAAWSGLDPLATFADRFTRADGAIAGSWTQDRGVWTIVSAKATCSTPSAGINTAWRVGVGAADGIFQYSFTTGATFHVALLLRRSASGDYIRLTSNGGTGWALQVMAGNAFSATIAQSGVMSNGAAPFAATTSYDVVIYAKGNKYFILVNDIPISANWLSDSGNTYLTALGIGIGDTSGFAATLYDNIAVLPLTVTLPTELQEGQSLATFQASAGSTIASDVFTDTNGTNITAHTPTSGPAWTLPLGGTATIQSNRLSFGNSNDHQLTIQAVGTAYHECQVTIATPNPLTRFVFAGICCAYVDSNNWFAARLAADDVAQPNDDEIEVVRRIAGVDTIVGKTQFGNYYTDQSHNPVVMKTQVISDGKGSNVLLVFLDGHYLESYYIPDELYASTHAGLYRMTDDDEGSTFDTWTVKALAASSAVGMKDTAGTYLLDTAARNILDTTGV